MPNRSVQDLYVAIGRRHIWIRTAAILPPYSDDWQLVVLDLTAGGPPPSWELIDWRYPNARLYTAEVTGQEVVKWLQGRCLALPDLDIPLPELAESSQCAVYRRASGASGVHGPFEWPYEEWTIPFSVVNQGSYNDLLIGDGDTPSFVTEQVAMGAMLGVDSLQGFDQRSSVFRQQSREAGIRGVHIFPSAVSVDVEGENVAGIAVELAGRRASEARKTHNSGAQTVELVRPSTDLTGTWVLLRRDGQWIDQRTLDPVYTRRGQADDVEIWVEPSTQVERLIAEGEGPTTEFKAEVPSEPLKMMKSVAAFANGEGGTILVGVANDGSIPGVPADFQGPDGEDRLTNMIRNWINPLPPFNVRPVELETPRGPQLILVVYVDPGGSPPYGAGTTLETLRYFVRRGATSFPAGPDQIRELARLKPPGDVTGGMFSRPL